MFWYCVGQQARVGLQYKNTTMYKLKQLLPVFILAIGSMSFFACKKSSSTTTTPSGTGKPFYCKLDGTAYIPAGGGRFYNVSSGTGIQIVGDDATTTIELHLTAVATGSYALGVNTTPNFASVYYNAGGKEYVSTTGEVKITKSDGTKISGTFHYTATGTAGNVEVTDGEFNDIVKQ
ncbi:MAG: hypothetical protein JWQ38_785 [Flavipsychrobacter sp.]|nr:hypothetical protein [Flavipsychrobacter sp.]